MVAAAVLWMLLPLWRGNRTPDQLVVGSPKERRASGLILAITLPILAFAMYAGLSNWDWDAPAAQEARAAQMEDALQQLEARLAESPHDVEGWLLLGRSYTSLGRFPRAVEAFQHAYDLTNGDNLEATVGLAEALFLADQTSLTGRAGQLFEAALARAPNHPKALWYGAVAALQSGDLQRGRDRLQLLLAQNPPDELRSILQRQIDDLNAQLGEGQASGPQGEPADASSAARAIDVQVSIAPEIQRQLTSPASLYVLARDPAGGPPLAVQRHSSASAPLKVQLTEQDAMMPSRTIGSVQRVQVVARVSRSGSPQAQSGDFFGEAEFEFGKDSGTLNIIIDRTVP
jgi:cytochrome c-type biogenesis protein CcmH